MTIGVDVSPLKSGHYLQHRVRGTGFYLRNLQKSLQEYYPDNKYVFFNRGEKLLEKVNIAHYPYFEPFFLTLPLFSKNKFVVTVHDLTPLVFPQHFPIGFKGKIKWQIQKAILRKADGVITDSMSSKKDIVKYTGIDDSRVEVVYLAVGEEFKIIQNPESKIKNLKKKYNLPEKFVLYVGDVTWNKNLPRLIEAVTKVNIPLIMVGKVLVETGVDLNNPWNKDLVKTLKLIDSQKNIFRLGFVSQEELIALYNLATVFAMPSLYEGFGLPILEAMSCGCPVVTSKEGSIPEIVGDSSMSVDAYSVNSIAQGITKVFHNESLQKDLSSRGVKQAKKFTWHKTVKETMRVYEGVLN